MEDVIFGQDRSIVAHVRMGRKHNSEIAILNEAVLVWLGLLGMTNYRI